MADFGERFTEHFAKTAALSALIPSVVGSVSWFKMVQDLKPAFDKFASFLPDCEEVVKAEFVSWKSQWDTFEEIIDSSESDRENENEISVASASVGKRKPNSAIRAINACYEEIYPNIFVLLTILATLPVKTCEAERLFSRVERTLSAIRSTMGEKRLESLLLMQSPREDLPSSEEVVKVFPQSPEKFPLSFNYFFNRYRLIVLLAVTYF